MFKLKIKSRRMKGGGGTSTASTIPEWADPTLRMLVMLPRVCSIVES